jgi:hypothetical protein
MMFSMNPARNRLFSRVLWRGDASTSIRVCFNNPRRCGVHILLARLRCKEQVVVLHVGPATHRRRRPETRAKGFFQSTLDSRNCMFQGRFT